ncbi:hypothetical protein J7E99_04125 [Streptomyces sp. ISL-44]|uniref:hypothetical protein n=1 Tax=Streptomyces sp. ISL-44 TaxID=2819184 RepID=UPI001BE6C0DE|nr:hypothetical protein [Streptomyces sp. ISL-44]MBT2539913.1 hypothetical protein [Streptomyces sp. ISL-44]
MTTNIIHSYARGVLSIDTADGPWPGLEAVSGPSQDLLDRALVCWERFLRATGEELSDE